MASSSAQSPPVSPVSPLQAPAEARQSQHDASAIQQPRTMSQQELQRQQDLRDQRALRHVQPPLQTEPPINSRATQPSQSCSSSMHPSSAHISAKRIFERRQRIQSLIWTTIGVVIAIIAGVFTILAHLDAQAGNEIAANALSWTQKWEMYKYCIDLQFQASQFNFSISTLADPSTANSIIYNVTDITQSSLPPSAAFLANYGADYVSCLLWNVTGILHASLVNTTIEQSTTDPILSAILAGVKNPPTRAWYYVLAPVAAGLMIVGWFAYQATREDHWDIARKSGSLHCSE